MKAPRPTSRVEMETYYNARTKYVCLWALTQDFPEPYRTLVIREEMENAS